VDKYGSFIVATMTIIVATMGTDLVPKKMGKSAIYLKQIHSHRGYDGYIVATMGC
jgi:hypothetical protein